MRIALYANWFPPSVGGVETSSGTMADALRELGHHVTAITSTLETAPNERDLADRVVRTTSFRQVFAAVRGSDLIISNGFCRPAAMAAMLRGIPLLVWHVMAKPSFERGFGPKVWVQNAITAIGFRYAKMHVGISRTCLEAKQLPDSIVPQVVYFPPATRLCASQNGQPRPAKVYDVVYNGRMVEEKGIFVLANALCQLDANGYRVSACFTGKGPDLDRVRQRVAGLRSVSVDVLGYVSDEELAGLYKHAKVAVIPSTTHPEGMGITAANALVYGCPIIVSDQGALVEVGDDACVIARNGSVDDICRAIRRVLGDPALRERLVANAKHRGLAFTYERFRGELDRLVRECVPQKSHEYARECVQACR